MPKIILNPLVKGISGKMGDVVFKVSKSGKTYISKRPEKSKKESSPAQLRQQERFKLANAYAHEVKDEPIYSELADRTGRSASRIAFSDWCHPPVIWRVERYIDHIDIYAIDDVQVEKVYVTIRNEEGITLEQGSASKVHEGWWRYETEVPGSILVEAFDLAGNVARQEVAASRLDS